MTANKLQKLICAARGKFVPGVPMDARADQDILIGIVDGLGGDWPKTQDGKAWKAGILIGRELRKALR